MEYPSSNDFYLKLKAIYNKDGNFIDYLFTYISENFYKATKISPNLIFGEKISDIVVEYDNILGLKDIYFNLVPKIRGKHELYIQELDRWYLINIFTDIDNKDEPLIIFYNDISNVRTGSNFRTLQNDNYSNNIYYLKDRTKSLFKDELTHTYNKDFFEEEIFRLDTKRQLPISFITFNINGLKLINDAFGKGMGDKVLIQAAKIIMSSLRKEDITSRIGGNKFITMLPKTSKEEAQLIVSRIENLCENNPLDFLKINISFVIETKKSENEQINEILDKCQEKMFLKNLNESKEANLAIINFLKSRLEKITNETNAHYERLRELCFMMADNLGLSIKEREELALLCEFHDIGKIGISNNILQKEGTLNKEEWENIKKHSEIGYNITKEIRENIPIDQLILNHHERWDGEGYPGHLKGRKIPIIVRIFAIADAYDAMVNGRSYKNRMNNKQALEEIKEKSGSQFDPVLTKIFIQIMNEEDKII